MQRRILLADVGGTNVRFAILAGDTLGAITHMVVADYASFGDAIAAFLTKQSKPNLSAVLGVAGAVEDGRCVLTNSSWVVDATELRDRFDFSDICIVNDFEAIAWSLPKLGHRDLRQLGGGEPKVDAPMLVLGPGTGLGVAAYVPRGQVVIHSEGGHASLPGGSPREDAVIAALRQQFGHVSAERVLSGPGLENLYRVVAALDGIAPLERSAAEITHAALAGACLTSRIALDLFCSVLGEVAGNFALGFCAQGGIFIAGGIAPQIADYLPRSQFRTRFEAKGRMSSYVEPIPTYLIQRADSAFIGLQALAARYKSS